MKICVEIKPNSAKETLEVYEYKIILICHLLRIPYYYVDILKYIYNEEHKSIVKDLQYDEELYSYESYEYLWYRFAKKYHQKPLSIRRYLGLLKNYNILLKRPVIDKLVGSYQEAIDYTYIVNTKIINNETKLEWNIDGL